MSSRCGYRTCSMIVLAVLLTAAAPCSAALIDLHSGDLAVAVDTDLKLTVMRGSIEHPIWQSVGVGPAMQVTGVEAFIALGSAGQRDLEAFDDGAHRGQRLKLSAFPNAGDLELTLIYALAESGELLVQVEQTGGENTVSRIAGLYDWQLAPAADAYTVVPKGSGYIIRSDQPAAVSLTGFIGAAYALPMAGMVRGNETCYFIVDTWWDATITFNHQPANGTSVSLDWPASLGKLGYARQVRFRFAQGLDHVGMAKGYRRDLIDRGQFSTLAERARTLPALSKYLSGIEYRWVGWNPEQYAQTLKNIRQFQAAGLPVSFFFPKWPARGYSVERSKLSAQNAGWQGFLQPMPVPGGWPRAREMANAARDLGCAIKIMVNPNLYFADAPAYDPDKASGVWPALSDNHKAWAIALMLDNLESKGVKFEALYFDGDSAASGHREHSSKAGGPVSRRAGYEGQSGAFRETRSRGIVPGGELARFWAIADCSFFFFMDWSADRLRNAEPIPWLQLAMGDCYSAHFSGGGYYNEGKYDWYEDRHPRLYELMYKAIPSHNWLPGGSRVIQAEDWGTDKMNRRLEWLKKWHQYYQKVRYAEMLNHEYVNASRTLQRVTFDNGVVADFDLDRGMYRVAGVQGFSGDWETPVVVER
jgi:hypothetical protein